MSKTPWLIAYFFAALFTLFICVLVVPGPVTSLTATERGAFHVKVEWHEPVNKNGIITHYLIQYNVG